MRVYFPSDRPWTSRRCCIGQLQKFACHVVADENRSRPGGWPTTLVQDARVWHLEFWLGLQNARTGDYEVRSSETVPRRIFCRLADHLHSLHQYVRLLFQPLRSMSVLPWHACFVKRELVGAISCLPLQQNASKPSPVMGTIVKAVRLRAELS